MQLKSLIVVVLTLGPHIGLAQPTARRVPELADDDCREAYVTPEPQGPVLHCTKKGWCNCFIRPTWLAAARLTENHDATLSEATAQINRILNSLTPPQGKKLCLYRSLYGPVLLWAKTGADLAEPTPRPARPSLAAGAARAGAASPRGGLSDVEKDPQSPRPTRDPQAIANLLGIQPSGRAAGATRLAEVFWPYPGGPEFWKCVRPGNDCEVSPRLNAAARTASHDERLAAATEEINRILEQAAQKSPGSDRSLCLLFTPDGPMLTWTFTTERPGRVVGPDDPSFRRVAREALGLAP